MSREPAAPAPPVIEPPAPGSGAAGAGAGPLGADVGAPASRRRWPRRLGEVLLVLIAGAMALRIAHAAGVVGISGAGSALRVIVAAVVLSGLCGLPLVKLALPESLRARESLWILPTGACAAELALTALGYAAVPLAVSLAVVLVAGATGSLAVLVRARRSGAAVGPLARAGRWRGVRASAWPLWVAALVAAVALVPMFRAGRPTVLGDGSDAHLAVGTAQFLQHDPPWAVDPNQPVNRVPLVWQSKPPIYYGLAAASKLSGLPTYYAIAPLAAFLLGLGVLGFYVLTTVSLRAPPAAALAAMALVGLDRMVLHTVMHPYFNQTAGFAVLPWAIPLGQAVLRERSGRGLALLALFLGLLAFAYPLALPIPLIFLGAAAWCDRRDRRARGEPLAELGPALRRLYRGRRSLVWMVLLGLVLIVPALGVVQKMSVAAGVVAIQSLHSWSGDLHGYFPEPQFLSIARGPAWPVLAAAIVALAVLALRRLPRDARWGFGAVLAFAAIFTVIFRLRPYGYYFHFKVLAFCAPLLLCCAVAGLAGLRRTGAVVLALWVLSVPSIALAEIGVTFDQLPVTLLALRGFRSAVPADASIRLDVDPAGEQLWVAYMLAPHPLCSQEPLVHTSYPHVAVSRKAAYVLVQLRPHGDLLVRSQPPFDAVGPPLRANADWALYRMNPAVAGPDTCSKLRVQTVSNVNPAS